MVQVNNFTRHLLRLCRQKETIIYPKGDILNYSQKGLAVISAMSLKIA